MAGQCHENKNSPKSAPNQPRKYTTTIPTNDGEHRNNRVIHSAPWWTPKVETKIDVTKDKAKDQYYEMHHEESTAVIIYTDGSGIKGKIGAAIYDATIN
jgi:hypothetical protein